MNRPPRRSFARAARLVLVAATALAPRLAAQAGACAGTPPLPADSFVALGRFWHAERAAPALPRAPRAVSTSLGLLHARIRAGLGRWNEVEQVLRRIRGADTLPEAIALFAQAAEQRKGWAEAEAGYRRLSAMAAAPPVLRVPALVRRALALEMLGRRDSALAAWRRAAQALPGIADWFAIHRAALERDTALAFASAADSRSPGAALRAGLLVAARRAGAGNLVGALEAYRRLDRPLDMARIEFLLGDRRTARFRADLLLFRDPIRPEALLAANLLAAQRDTLSVAELAATSRVYRALGDLRGAERPLRLALARADTSLNLWLDLASLFADRRDRRGAFAAADSAERHARRTKAPPEAFARIGVARVAALAAVREWDTADSLLAQLTPRFPGDTSIARAVLLLAEHDRAAAQGEAERERYQLLLRDFTATPAATVARFRAGLSAYALGRRDSAATAFVDVLARDTAHLLGTAPRFWDARVRFERGDPTGRVALQRIADAEPLTYYGVRARILTNDSLGFVTDSVGAPRDTLAPPPGRAGERIRLLMLVGLEQEARDEALGWAADPTAPVPLLLLAVEAANAVGFAREAIRLGEAARVRAGLSVGAARGVLPFPYRTVIDGEATEACLDPLLLAAIIRQETRFTPRAVSRVGARGLAQVMPATGRDLARLLHVSGWDPELLFIPDFNLHLGARFLHDRLQASRMPLYAAIAAYDAGAQRVDRWRSWPEFTDPDLFVERVAISETRNYVKTVYASYLWYRRAYAAPGGPDAPAAPASPAY